MKKMDFHIHTYSPISFEQKVANMKDLMERKGYCGLGFMALMHNSRGFHPEANDETLALKKALPGTFAFANLDHGRDFVEYAKELMAQGFDGIKLLDGKPSEYRFWGHGYEHWRFDEFFAFAEEEQIPVLIHNNDPRANWDPNNPKVDHLREKGWYYGDGDLPSQEEFFVMLENVFKKHPRLRAAIAHLGFYYDNLPRAAALLDACPNLYMDMTPAVEVYMELSQTPAEAEAFVRKYYDRLIFGTDAMTSLEPGTSTRTFNDAKTEMMRVFYEGDAPCVVAGKYPVTPIHVEPYMLEAIYYENALRFMKKTV